MISRLYQDVGCEHHLVQEQSTTTPEIPALTTVGFSQWMTLQILADPEREAARLQKLVMETPINANTEVKKGEPWHHEQLPRDLPRYLLPSETDRFARKTLENAVSNFFNDLGTQHRRKGLPNIVSEPRRELYASRLSQPLERERNPYTPSASGSSSSEDKIRIQRERKSYSTQPLERGRNHTPLLPPNLQAMKKILRSNASGNYILLNPEAARFMLGILRLQANSAPILHLFQKRVQED
jgi:hypothetical protein